MSPKQYYIAPPEGVFEDIRSNAIKIWQTYDDTYKYASGKINHIKELQNIGDNAWHVVGMFDMHNQTKLLLTVKSETRKMILDAMNI